MPASLLFVCLGNICRSPMAEAIARHRATALGLEVDIASAGTAAYHTGDPADARTLAVLKRHGIAHNGRARAVAPEDFTRFDLLLAMDASNLANLQRMAPKNATARLCLMLEPLGAGREVGDPYYGGPAGFDRVFEELSEAMDAWLVP